MEEELEKLNELSDFFHRMNRKILLLKLINQAKSEYDKYDYSAGRRTLVQACLIDRKNSTVLRGLGCIHQFSGKLELAKRYFKTALKYSDNKEIEYTLLGMVYYLQDNLDEAIVNFNCAIDNNENYEKAYEGRNQAMLENHLKIIDLQEALKKYF